MMRQYLISSEATQEAVESCCRVTSSIQDSGCNAIVMSIPQCNTTGIVKSSTNVDGCHRNSTSRNSNHSCSIADAKFAYQVLRKKEKKRRTR